MEDSFNGHEAILVGRQLEFPLRRPRRTPTMEAPTAMSSAVRALTPRRAGPVAPLLDASSTGAACRLASPTVFGAAAILAAPVGRSTSSVYGTLLISSQT